MARTKYIYLDENPIYDKDKYREMGFVEMTESLYLEPVFCFVLERKNPVAQGWEYKVVVTDFGLMDRVLNEKETLTRAPSLDRLSKMLMRAKLMEKDEEPNVYEWMLGIFGDDDIVLGFPDKNLRDRALDEEILGWGIGSNSRVSLYEVNRFGEKENRTRVNVPKWVTSRDLFELGSGKDYRKAQARLRMGLVTMDVDEVGAALSAGADPVGSEPYTGLTALHKMARRGCAPIVKALLEHGCDVDAKDLAGNSALHLAARGGYTETCLELAEFGADLRSKGSGRRTAIMEAAKNGHLETEGVLRSVMSRRLVTSLLAKDERGAAP